MLDSSFYKQLAQLIITDCQSVRCWMSHNTQHHPKWPFITNKQASCCKNKIKCYSLKQYVKQQYEHFSKDLPINNEEISMKIVYTLNNKKDISVLYYF